MSDWLSQFQKQYWTASNIFAFALVFSWLSFLWRIYLSYRQYRVYVNNKKVPQEVEQHLDQETMDKSRLYNIDKSRYSFVYGIWSQILSTALLWFDAIPLSWHYSGDLLRRAGVEQVTEIYQTLTLIMLSSAVSFLLDLPWNLYYTFVLEEKHGFNKYTLKFYFTDRLKKKVVFDLFTLAIVGSVIKIILLGGKYFFIYLWLFCSIVVLVLFTIYPDFIAPLFDKYVPLPESSLKTEIEKLTKSLKYPLSQIYIVEGSKRSSHSNAYLYGMFNRKKIVLYDTLIDKSVMDVSELFDSKKAGDKPEEQSKPEDEKPLTENKSDEKGTNKSESEGCTESEILAVLGHELGHWKLNHIIKNLFFSEINMLFAFGVFGLLYQNKEVYAAFGLFNEKPIFIGLFIIFEYIFHLYNEIISFLMTSLTRLFEFQADAFAKQLGLAEDLKKSLVKLNKTNLSFPLNDWLYSAVNHTHPPLLERLAALSKTE